MSFAPPPGPPPPSVPEGWTTQFDDTYKQWFFINLTTGKSQWEPPQSTPAPTPQAPAQAPIPASEQPHADQPGAPPPSYEESGPGNPSTVADAEDFGKKKANYFSSNNPYNGEPASGPGASGASAKDTTESDAALAARLQAEEDARSSSTGPGTAAGYYDNDTPHSPTSSFPAGDRDKGKDKKKGFFSKLMGKASSSQGYSSRPPAAYGGYRPSQPGYGAPSPGPGYGAPGGFYPPQQGYGPGPGYGAGYGPQPVYGYPQQPYYGGGMQPQRRPGGGGMGMAGAAALGVGGGLLGGALLADAIDDHHDHDDYGGDYGGGGGDDFGGGDF
ncbi:uncharacterized protein APUU_60560S [Aspergillus puulaauensis]|uniref:WW domain-containing protein n=1 Tax=Aspergillus puulaauensis TaxID=1220207 RepID=A0A7R7XUC5_9EURO|nr:uncharacterized protein APUU_60560S [Aspergillus puulaauensis]BCS27512.1 hypothetical protein APUU_60560S [Aspergillus puulaauensis]